jgi:hypothetical protein
VKASFVGSDDAAGWFETLAELLHCLKDSKLPIRHVADETRSPADAQLNGHEVQTD